MNISLPDEPDPLIQAAAQYRPKASLMNRTLYSMCKRHPKHNNEDVVKSKLMLIGRSYSAALERRRTKSDKSEDIYKVVANDLIASTVDAQISSLMGKELDSIQKDDIKPILELHKYFVDILYKRVDMNKRSLASKYLHFHLPELFFIYDSIAVNKLRAYVKDSATIKLDGDCDPQYSVFCQKMLILRDGIKHKYEIMLNPRQLDWLLLQY